MKCLPIILLLASIPVWHSCELDDLTGTSPDLTGIWDVQENSKFFKKTSAGFYTVQIKKHPADTTAILIKNFYAIDIELRAQLDGRDLSIPQQLLGGYIFKGFGRVSANNNKIDWFYTVDFRDGDIDTVNAVYTRSR